MRTESAQERRAEEWAALPQLRIRICLNPLRICQSRNLAKYEPLLGRLLQSKQIIYHAVSRSTPKSVMATNTILNENTWNV